MTIKSELFSPSLNAQGFRFEQPTAHPDPKGAAHGCAAFSDRAMDGESENPLNHSVNQIDSSRKAVSFGYFSLGQQRKVTRDL